MPNRELIKVVATAVLIERDDDGQVTGELTSDPRTAYNANDLAAIFTQAQVDVDAWNAENRPPNRAERRSRK